MPGLALAAALGAGLAMTSGSDTAAAIRLPPPRQDGTVSVEEALRLRRSVRSFADRPLSLQAAAQLLWAAQGTSDPAEGKRTAPSAGATYPLELLLVAGNVAGLEPGIYRYRTGRHELLQLAPGDRRRQLAEAALRQTWLAEAPAVVVIVAVYERTARRYGQRAERYVHMEVGHAGENLYLQAVALRLATVMVGAFDDDAVGQVLGLDGDEQPLALMPVGIPAGQLEGNGRPPVRGRT
jgi:SagB-type dehydrogenase family enzyme